MTHYEIGDIFTMTPPEPLKGLSPEGTKMSWKTEVIADNSGTWAGNGLRFATKEEAESYVLDLSMRWTSVRDTRTVECDDAVNYAIVDRKLTALS